MIKLIKKAYQRAEHSVYTLSFDNNKVFYIQYDPDKSGWVVCNLKDTCDNYPFFRYYHADKLFKDFYKNKLITNEEMLQLLLLIR